MAAAFNMLRPNDLIWPYVIANYFKGKEPPPFDLLYWNSDTTRMPAANHSFYLRNCYLENDLSRGEMEIGGVTLDLRKVKIPIYNLATREDHIAPPRSVFYGSSFFGGKVTFVLTGSGHIAGVINPPARNKYQYWTGPAPKGDSFDSLVQEGARSTPAPGGRTGRPGSRQGISAVSPPTAPAGRSSRRSRPRRAATSGSSREHDRLRAKISRECD